MERFVIVDGYTDEPAGLGVPPYLDVYVRYVAGAIWTLRPKAQVTYFTVDEVRRDVESFLKVAERAKAVIFVAGITVPGKYLGGEPVTLDELELWARMLDNPVKVLGGPVARFGMGVEGGRIAELPTRLLHYFDLVVKGDIEAVIYDLVKEGLSPERVDPCRVRESYDEIAGFAVKGARIALDHPNYGYNLIAEIETFRGCPRYVCGGCSFCIEPLYGGVTFRPLRHILEEVRALYEVGVRNFRLGRQPDLYSYMAKDTGKEEFPKPNVEAIKELFKGIRSAAPGLEVLHIDNVNPGTLVHHPRESKEITKIIVKYHTPGDVAALGVESADPRVIKLNNLKVYPEEALEAIRLLNEIGGLRGYNGLPELLPGINFVYGLIGESKETYELNYEFLKRLLEEGLLVRRINIRQVIAFPGTRMWSVGDRVIKRHKKLFKAHKEKVRREIDLPMLRKVAPKGCVLRRAFTELYEGKYTLARQAGSYPLLIYCPTRLPLRRPYDFIVFDHGYRSVSAIPYPLNLNEAQPSLINRVPGLDRVKAKLVLSHRPFSSLDDIKGVLGKGDYLCYVSAG